VKLSTVRKKTVLEIELQKVPKISKICTKDSYFGCYFCSDILYQQKNLRIFSESAQFHPQISKEAASACTKTAAVFRDGRYTSKYLPTSL